MASPVSSVEMTRGTSTYPYPKIQTAPFRSRRAHAVFTLEDHSGQGMSPSSHQTRLSMPIARGFSWREAGMLTKCPCMASNGGSRTGVAPTYTRTIYLLECPAMQPHTGYHTRIPCLPRRASSGIGLRPALLQLVPLGPKNTMLGYNTTPAPGPDPLGATLPFPFCSASPTATLVRHLANF